MRVIGATDVGLRRKENQDTFSVAREGTWQIAVVCDGMGGEKGGKLASSIAVETYLSQLKALLRPEMTIEQLRELSSFCAAHANTAVYQHALSHPSCRGMGTTLVSVITDGEIALVSNIGDSRAYLVRGGKLSRVTHDHSVVESLVEAGDITAEEARTHPNRNLITRALGPEASTACDTYEMKLKVGDRLLLCSDGLTVTATDEQIERTVCQADSIDNALTALIELAKQYGAPDNVTAVLLHNL